MDSRAIRMNNDFTGRDSRATYWVIRAIVQNTRAICLDSRVLLIRQCILIGVQYSDTCHRQIMDL